MPTLFVGMPVRPVRGPKDANRPNLHSAGKRRKDYWSKRDIILDVRIDWRSFLGGWSGILRIGRFRNSAGIS